MKIFVAGASGTIGVPLVRALVASGHQVTAMTRTPGKAPSLAALGAIPVVVNAFDRTALTSTMLAARPTHVIHQLTALPRNGPKRTADLVETNRLRDQGTRNLIAAARAAGVRRFIGGSFAIVGAPGQGRSRGIVEAADAVRSMESQIVEASLAGAFEGIVLRYGGFYGPGVPMTDDLVERVRSGRVFRIRGDRGRIPFIHISDAVGATIAALDHGRSGATYDIVDGHAMSFSDVVTTVANLLGVPPPRAIPLWIPRLLMPYFARFMSIDLPLSNQAAQSELGWRPLYPTVRDGLATVMKRAA
jgi:nucleoside-diphosphate-sugar epimerase